MIALLLVTLVFSPFAIMFACFLGQSHRVAAAFMRFVMRRRSLAVPIRRSLLSPTTGADWKVSDGTRIVASNDRTGISAWAYGFSTESHLFHDQQEITLPGWEQYILNRALRQRGRLRRAEERMIDLAANDDRIVKLAEHFCDTYGRHA